MNNVLQVARYIITKIDEPIPKFKLQNLVYYCQAWSLAWDDTKLFDEDFEITYGGLVCKTLLDKHKDLIIVGKDSLKEVNIEGVFTKDQLETIDSVINYYGNKDPFWLSELVRKEKPWLETTEKYNQDKSNGKIIDKSLIKEYYKRLERNIEL